MTPFNVESRTSFDAQLKGMIEEIDHFEDDKKEKGIHKPSLETTSRWCADSIDSSPTRDATKSIKTSGEHNSRGNGN